MNEQLIRFIELCLVDGLITDKEREVIFRKAKEHGVPDDECEVILDGMLYKRHQDKKQASKSSAIQSNTDELDLKLSLASPPSNEINSEFLRQIYFSDHLEQIALIDRRLTELGVSDFQEKLEENQLKFDDLIRKKRVINPKSNKAEWDRIEEEIAQNDKALIELNGKIDLVKTEGDDLEKKRKELKSKFNEQNFELFVELFRHSPILYHSPIFGKALQESMVDNDEQILNLTRFHKFLTGKEKHYSRLVKECFDQVEAGSITRKKVSLTLIERKSLISFYNSFYLMLSSLSAKKMGVYMNIYLELESLGMFNSHYEKNVLANLSQLNQQLSQLNSTLNQVVNQISKTNNYLQLLDDHMYNMRIGIQEANHNLSNIDYRLGDISFSIEEGNRNLERSNDLLQGIQKDIGLNNLLTGIQTYQMYKINKNTKSLRE